jgi:membrane protein DedA with SNARE-associated domain
MTEAFQLLLAFSGKIGYFGVFFFMTIESSFIPFPSEIVIPPAAYLAHQGELNLLGVIAAGILGSLTGALINYYLAMTLGRKMIYSLANKKISRMLLINERKIEHAERYFLKYGRVSTFMGRLVPVVRELISLPAGFSRMNIRAFVLLTALGSGIWVTILAVLGYVFGSNKDLLYQYFQDLKLFMIGVAFLAVLFFIYRRQKRRFLY